MITNLRKSKKSSRPAVFFSILVIGVIGFLVITNWKINQRRAGLQQKIEVFKKQIQILEEKSAALRTGISRTEKEDYQTEELYKQGYFEEGAIPVVVLPPAEEETEAVKKEEEKSPWQKFLEKIGF